MVAFLLVLAVVIPVVLVRVLVLRDGLVLLVLVDLAVVVVAVVGRPVEKLVAFELKSVCCGPTDDKRLFAFLTY